MTRAERRARRRWLHFWERRWHPLPWHFTWRTSERLHGPIKLSAEEMGFVESVRWVAT